MKSASKTVPNKAVEKLRILFSEYSQIHGISLVEFDRHAQNKFTYITSGFESKFRRHHCPFKVEEAIVFMNSLWLYVSQGIKFTRREKWIRKLKRTFGVTELEVTDDLEEWTKWLTNL